MNKMFLKITGVMMAVFFVSMSSAMADEVTDLKNQVNRLNNVIASLTDRISSLEGREASKPVLVHPGHGTPQAEGPGGMLLSTQDIQIGGHLDVQYSRTLSDQTAPRTGTAAASGLNAGNVGRIFDTNQDTFMINAVELNFTKEANPDGGAGFRVDIAMGEDAAVVDFDPSTDMDEFSIQQAYVEYNQPLGFWDNNEILPDTINFKVGRFVTLAGLEVIEGPDNWNISRSFAFGLTIPFTHVGLRTNFGLFNDYLDVTLGINNGWDTVIDNNTYKTLEAGVGYSPLENVSAYHAIYWGPETNNTNAHKRFLLTNVLAWDVTDKFSVMGEFNFGNERRSILTLSNSNTNWQSYNLYGRYQVTDKFALAYRAELFQDSDMFRTALDNTLWENTVTAEYALTDNLITRLEYRYDKADHFNAFDTDSSQQTLGAQVLYLIG